MARLAQFITTRMISRFPDVTNQQIYEWQDLLHEVDYYDYAGHTSNIVMIPSFEKVKAN